MKAVVTIEIEINEDVLEHRNIDKASFVKKHLVLNRCIPDGAYLTHDMERFTSEYGSENLFTNVRILSALPTRMKKTDLVSDMLREKSTEPLQNAHGKTEPEERFKQLVDFSTC